MLTCSKERAVIPPHPPASTHTHTPHQRPCSNRRVGRSCTYLRTLGTAVYMLYWYKSTNTDAEGFASLRQRITTAGCVEHVIHAMNAVDATTTTQTWGQEILDRLRWLE